jgi:hypothetical protein
MQPRNNVLYPHWEIYLSLDKVYPVEVTSVHIMMWADTGEISSIKATGTLGGPISDDSTTSPTIAPSPSAAPTQQQTSEPSLSTQPAVSSSPQQTPTVSPSLTLPPSQSSPQSTDSNKLTDQSVQIAVVATALIAVSAATAAFLLKRKPKRR